MRGRKFAGLVGLASEWLQWKAMALSGDAAKTLGFHHEEQGDVA